MPRRDRASRVSPPTVNVSEPLEHHAELLVLVAVLGNGHARIELDERERDALAVHGTAEDAVPDPLRLNPAEVGERAHAGNLSGRPVEKESRNRHTDDTDT